MTDLRARLADALREAGIARSDFESSSLSIDRIVDVLLSLPGIAIVEVSDVRPTMFPDAARDLAATLLAAANAGDSPYPPRPHPFTHEGPNAGLMGDSCGVCGYAKWANWHTEEKP